MLLPFCMKGDRSIYNFIVCIEAALRKKSFPVGNEMISNEHLTALFQSSKTRSFSFCFMHELAWPGCLEGK